MRTATSEYKQPAAHLLVSSWTQCRLHSPCCYKSETRFKSLLLPASIHGVKSCMRLSLLYLRKLVLKNLCNFDSKPHAKIIHTVLRICQIKIEFLLLNGIQNLFFTEFTKFNFNTTAKMIQDDTGMSLILQNLGYSTITWPMRRRDASAYVNAPIFSIISLAEPILWDLICTFRLFAHFNLPIAFIVIGPSWLFFQ